jgi:hypothetical protein
VSARTYEIEVQRTQYQTVEVKASSLAEAVKKVDRRDFIFDESRWSTFKDAWLYKAPVDENGRYDADSSIWEEQ